MRLLITGICGFVGSTLARCLFEMIEGIEILGIDSLIRRSSELTNGHFQNLGLRSFTEMFDLGVILTTCRLWIG